MKTITLLVASIFLLGSVANASEIINFSGNEVSSSFSLDEPIEFTERGITFYVFPNGEFDFNTQQNSNTDIIYRNGRRTTNQTFGTPSNGGLRIEHDNFGRIRRIGNVFVNYDFDNRIKRIGSVYMSYNHFALSQVGGLRIIYNRRGQIVDMFGIVKGFSTNYCYNYSNENDFDCIENENNSNDNDHLYYRKNGKSEKKEDKK